MMMKDTAVVKAFDIANKASLTPHELIELEKRAKYVYEEEMRLADALDRGREEGREEGEIKGLQKAILNILHLRFGVLPAEIEEQLQQASLSQLRELVTDAAVVATVEAFMAEITP